MAGADLRDQLDVIWSNLRAKLADEGMTLDNLARVTSYLREPAYIDTTAAANAAALGDRPVPMTAVVTATLAENWLVEIGLIAIT